MSLELNRATFRRLVQLRLVTLVLTIAVIVAEIADASWLAFSDDFDVLVVKHFGPAALFDSWSLLSLFGALLIWMVAADVGLLWFKRWARWGVWASTAALLALMVLIEGYRPSYSSPGSDALSLIDGALMGAILIMAYARGYGTEWFGGAMSPNKV